jgi:hypothetical protein
VPDLVKNFYAQSGRRILKDIFVHLDNARLHNSRQSCECFEGFRAYRIPHPVYSPGLVPNDFFLFGYLKTKLAGLVIQNKEELIRTIGEIFDEIPRERLISVYLSWEKIDMGDQKQG